MLSFEERKKDHIAISLSPQSQNVQPTGLDRVQLIHEAIPDLDFSEINIATKTLGHEVATPIFVSSMTLGHQEAQKINHVIATVCEQKNLVMGVGSQRRQLEDMTAQKECRELRRMFPKLKIMGNLGISQLIDIPVEKVEELVASLEAQIMVIHTNPLQECIQPEGTPDFRGAFEALVNLSEKLSVPVVIKETGCGFSKNTLLKLRGTKIAAIDISGKGGTHWGRVESQRLSATDVRYSAGVTFSEWGMTTVESLLAARDLLMNCEVWASGGVRNGLDAAKFLAMGAHMVGVAKPILEKAVLGETALFNYLNSFEYELKVAMFCTGVKDICQLRKGGLWRWI